jgi:hypothetical protein
MFLVVRRAQRLPRWNHCPRFPPARLTAKMRGPRGDEAARNRPAVAEKLGVTATQLLKLFKKDPAAWTALNRLRTGAGLAALK